MSNKSKRRPPGGAGGFRTTSSGGTKAPKVSVKGSPLTKGKNSGGTQPAHAGEVQGSSHQGSSLGKRSSG
jgi:hypothetical protein